MNATTKTQPAPTAFTCGHPDAGLRGPNGECAMPVPAPAGSGRTYVACGATRAPARCYMEFCCNRATIDVVVANRGTRPDLAPIPWGWCAQHAPAPR